MCQWPFSRNILSAFDMQYRAVSIMHSFGPFWTTLMPREFILSRKLVGPFECFSGCSNLQPDSPPRRVPGTKRDRVGARSSFHSRRYTASDLSIMQSVGNRTTFHFDLVTFRLAVSRHVFIQSLPDLRHILAEVHSRQCGRHFSNSPGHSEENRCVVSVSFIRCKDSTGKSFLPISGFMVPGIGTVGGIPAEAV